jgi:hypothetical protein
MKKKQAKKQTQSKLTLRKSDLKTRSGLDKDQATMIVKIISIFEYISAGFGIIFGLILLFGRQFILGMLPIAELPQVPAAVLAAAMTMLAIFLIAFSIFAIFVARALWNHKNWARIVVVVFSSIGVVAGLCSLPSGIFGLILHGSIVYFLGFDKGVRELFK